MPGFLVIFWEKISFGDIFLGNYAPDEKSTKNIICSENGEKEFGIKKTRVTDTVWVNKHSESKRDFRQFSYRSSIFIIEYTKCSVIYQRWIIYLKNMLIFSHAFKILDQKVIFFNLSRFILYTHIYTHASTQTHSREGEKASGIVITM